MAFSMTMRNAASAGVSCKATSQSLLRPVRAQNAPCLRSLQGCVAPNARRQLTVVASVSAPKPTGTVKVVLQGRKLQVTEPIKKYVEDKISHACEHFTRVIQQVDVTLSARGGDTGTHGKKEQKVEVTIKIVRNGVVRVEDTEDSLYAAIDLVCDKIERKLTRVKEMAIEKGKWPGHAGPHHPHLEEDEFQEYRDTVRYETQVFEEEQALRKQFAELNKVYPAQVRRTKKVELDLMTVDEAIDAMEAVGHDFFVFREMETDSIQVIYRRQSEGYGILVPVKRE